MNHYGVTVATEIPITGVFQNNHVYYLFDGISNYEDLNFYDWMDEELGRLLYELQGIKDAVDGENYEASASDMRDVCERMENLGNDWEGSDCTTNLAGFVRTDEKKDSWYWFENLGFGFEPDLNAEFSAIIGEIYTQVVASKWLMRCGLCSPCFPGQGDADCEGSYLTYSVSPDMYDELEPIRSRIFKAEVIL